MRINGRAKQPREILGVIAFVKFENARAFGLIFHRFDAHVQRLAFDLQMRLARRHGILKPVGAARQGNTPVARQAAA